MLFRYQDTNKSENKRWRYFKDKAWEWDFIQFWPDSGMYACWSRTGIVSFIQQDFCYNAWDRI